MRHGLKNGIAAIAFAITSATGAGADVKIYTLPEESAAYRAGSGVETLQKNCLSCHSADYVTTQPKCLGAKFWKAEVEKMRKAYGAPITDDDARMIVDYLTRDC